MYVFIHVYMCVYVYMCVCVYVCMYVCTYVCVYTCVRIRVYMHKCRAIGSIFLVVRPTSYRSVCIDGVVVNAIYCAKHNQHA